MIALEDNEKLSIIKVLEFLIGVGTRTGTSSFDTQHLQFVTVNELKKVYARRFATFPFYLVVP